jgi:hypothetical protein
MSRYYLLIPLQSYAWLKFGSTPPVDFANVACPCRLPCKNTRPIVFAKARQALPLSLNAPSPGIVVASQIDERGELGVPTRRAIFPGTC